MTYARANLFLILPALASVLLFQDCATIFRTRTRPISVTSSSAPSTVSVNHKPGGRTPVDIRLARRRKGQVIRIESPGCNPLEIEIGRDTSAPDYLGDALLGAAAAGLVAVAHTTAKGDQDFWTDLAIAAPAGAAIRILIDLTAGEQKGSRTQELLVTLRKAEEPPLVETKFISAKEFKNVKWIRVHRD
jgi:hypothetical protein